MRKIDWHGNYGYLFPEPGEIKTAECGICGVQMHVERNVLGPTSWAGAIAGKRRRHDFFKCPKAEERWHVLIHELKTEVYVSEIGVAENIITRADYWRKKRMAAKKIRAILKKHAAR